jgi:hypothetical protein
MPGLTACSPRLSHRQLLRQARMWINPLTPRRCDRKVAYRSEPVAKKIARRAQERTGDPILEYKCPDCGKWHIGHASPGTYEAVHPEVKKRFPEPIDAHWPIDIPKSLRFALREVLPVGELRSRSLVH